MFSCLKSNRERSSTFSNQPSGGVGFGPVQTKPPSHEKKYMPFRACSSQGSIRNVRFWWFCSPARYPCFPSPRRINEPDPKFGDLKLPTSEISSSCAACKDPANALPTGSPRLASIRFESHFTSSFFATILFKSCKVLVTGSRRPQLSLPFHTIVGRYAFGSSRR